MRQKTAIALVLGLSTLFTANLVFAHHSFAAIFDADKVVTNRGVVTRFEWINPHSFVLVDTKGANGVVERWALEGPSTNNLVRRSIEKTFLKAGDIIEFCGYATRDGIEPIKSVSAPEPLSLGRVINAELLILPDGRKMVWQDYGQRKCRDAHNL